MIASGSASGARMPEGLAPMNVATILSGTRCGWPARFHCSIVGGQQMSMMSVAAMTVSTAHLSPNGPQSTWQHGRDLLRLNRSNCGTPYFFAIVEQVSPGPTRWRGGRPPTSASQLPS